jgi:hypothetical protein
MKVVPKTDISSEQHTKDLATSNNAIYQSTSPSLIRKVPSYYYKECFIYILEFVNSNRKVARISNIYHAFSFREGAPVLINLSRRPEKVTDP